MLCSHLSATTNLASTRLAVDSTATDTNKINGIDSSRAHILVNGSPTESEASNSCSSSVSSNSDTSSSNSDNIDNSNNITTANNNTTRQQNYEAPMSTTIREIKSRHVGSLSPLYQNHQNALNIHLGTNGATNGLPSSHLLIERRQAVSMERLNSLSHHHLHPHYHHVHGNQINRFQNCHKNGQQHHHSQTIRNLSSRDKDSGIGANISGGGSLSSGGSNTSIDNDSGEEHTTKISGLTRSASRVSRFKSAKEFFERLSSISQNCGGSVACAKLQNGHFHGDRSRGSVTDRYMAVAARASSQTNLSTIVNSSIPISTVSPAKISLQPAGVLTNNAQKQQVVSNRHATQIAQVSSSPANCPSSRTVNHPLAAQPPARVANNCPPPLSLAIPLNTTASSRPLILDTSTCSRFAANSGNIDHISGDNYPACSSPGGLSPNTLANCLTFKGDNVIIGNGSLLIRRNKQLKIKFDESSTLTFEYPSEEAMMAEADSSFDDQTTHDDILQRNSCPGPIQQEESKENQTSQGLLARRSIGLSSYQPSTLLTETPQANIDSQLGSKKLVTPNKPIGTIKSRINVDQWTNNGSIICAQSGIAKANATVRAIEADGDDKIVERQANRGARCDSKYSSASQLNNESRQDSLITSDQISESDDSTKPETDYNPSALITTKNQTNDPDDLKHLNPNNWSNGAGTTSDLLF